ncbi:MAG TPA: peptidoglycan bridge formation glycyltransferase FemA/FemB family protein [Nocardioides sp.]|uniref:lipid II:glycine glycyltransferase FemX n=1 Tax=Nocardioides sp. TaxID=35761 RepID=UPI002C9843DE|nr:peptidoglycan bridge formation glycyltransferase FemA/FemB family protein [Nocardioides sp.]HQR27863.1 peptidoglycan bridge formation glycyltransferase FemA/FemB family protein [Nocardioides sp.]
MTAPEPVPELTVRTLTPAEHLAFLDSPTGHHRSVSFLQTPAWGAVKSEWRHESLGWFGPTGGLVGAGLVLYRQAPVVRRSLAYLPEGPVIDWAADDLARWLTPMADHLRRAGAFAVRMGPPVVLRRWSAAQVKEGIAAPQVTRLGDLPPLERSAEGARVVAQLDRLGWLPQAVEDGFAAGQPQYNFWVPLTGADGPLTEQQVLAGMNQLWRRNIKKAEKAGVVVTAGTRADLPAFHALYVHTAERDHFTPRPLGYFQTMHDALSAEDPGRFTLFLAHHEGDLVAATIAIRVGEHAWYSYGASSTDKREVRGSNAVQWAMIRAAMAAGARVYDLRGITETLAADDPHVGLIQFKVGTGGQAVEYAGEWDLPLNRLLYRAFDLYLKRRG